MLRSPDAVKVSSLPDLSRCLNEEKVIANKRKRKNPDTDNANESIKDIKILVENLKIEQDSKYEKLSQCMERMEKQNDLILQSHVNLQKLLELNIAKYEEINKKVNNLVLKHSETDDRICYLEDQLEVMERNQRQTMIEIKNLPLNFEENLASLTNSLCNVLGLMQEAEHIKKSFTLKTGRKQSLIIEFDNVNTKNKIIQAIKKYGKEKQDTLYTTSLGISGEKSPIYFSDFLTVKARKIHSMARILQKQGKCKYCWVSRVVETGDEPVACYNRRTLVLANHQSTADVPMLMAAWNPRPGLLPHLMWIMDRVFKFTNFGIVSVLHEDFFIQAGKAKRDQSLEELRQHIHKYYMPLSRQFMVLFPEGGFLHKRREVSQRFAEKNNLPKLEYVSLPRAGALKVIMEEIGPHRDQGASTSKEINKDNNSNQSRKMIVDNNVGDSVEWVLDVTIAYPDRIPLHLQDVVCGFRQPCTTHLHYRLYPSSEVPSDTEGMTQWLYDRFVEKDQMLEEFYKTGKFPTKGNNPSVPRKVRQDNLRYLILHVFFIASTLLQYKLWCVASSYLW